MRGVGEREHLLPAALLVAVVVGAVLAYFLLPGLLVPGDVQPEVRRLQLRNDVRTSALALTGGIALVIGTYFTARTFQSNRQGQLTDRFTRAVEQLRSEQIEVRMGGIYALERIARESRRDHPRIMELLTAFIRARAPWPPVTAKGRADASPRLIVPETARDATEEPESTGADRKRPQFAPPEDVQAVLDVLGSRNTRYDDTHRIHDLGHLDLRGASLYEFNLVRVFLRETHLEGAMLSKARGETSFRRAVLTGANLAFARLDGCDFNATDLRGAFMFSADLRGAYFNHANLATTPERGQTYIERTQLDGARFLGANLEGARLVSASLREADFGGPRAKSFQRGGDEWRGAILDEADLESADLTKADLTRADLKGAKLEGATLDGTVLHGADLSGATGARLEHAMSDDKTVPPQVPSEGAGA